MGDHSDYDDYDDQAGPAPEAGMPTWMIVLIVLAIPCVAIIPCSIVAAIAVPNLVEARKHGNEAAAIGGLKTIATAQSLFREGDKDGNNVTDYGSLTALGQASLIDRVLASGSKQGYQFTCSPVKGKEQYLWWATASPAEPGKTGDRYFFTDQSGVVRYSLQPIKVNPKTGQPNAKLNPLGR